MSVGVDHTVSLARFDHRRTDSIFDAVQRRVELALGKDGSVVGRDQAVDLDHGGVANGGYCVVKDLVSWHVVFGLNRISGTSFKKSRRRTCMVSRLWPASSVLLAATVYRLLSVG